MNARVLGTFFLERMVKNGNKSLAIARTFYAFLLLLRNKSMNWFNFFPDQTFQSFLITQTFRANIVSSKVEEGGNEQ